MKHKLPELGFSLDALQPWISPETLEYHHGKHHAAYVEKLNEGLRGTELEDLGLEELIRTAEGGVFNNAAQHFNHSLYWSVLRPGGAKAPEGEVAKAIGRDFGSLEALRKKLTSQSNELFSNGWTWLVRDPSGRLSVRQTANAHTPVEDEGAVPVLTCDVWEHAYYIDYRNERPKYVEAFWSLVNWTVVGERYGS